MVKKAREGQMTDTLNADDRQDYLDQPVNDLHKIHGHFTDEAKERATSVTSGMPGKCCSAPSPSRVRSWRVFCLAETIISAVRYDRSRTSGSHSR